MATDLHNLSEYNPNNIPSGEGKKIAIVVSEWNSNITENLLQGAYDTLIKFGVTSQNILIHWVPGSFELTFGAKTLIEKIHPDALIMLGCVIQGETPHFTYVCQSVTQGATELNIKYDVPVIFGLLTTTTLEQAKDRAGGRHGNKGDEAAITALKMIALNNREF
ncbi:MAG TPA: 6,7-dimethyl-8-ribityllumazine synthase [Dysgonamonadaceae bacterium]|jgi:6,7-dimethyl-8-ribityllumazine synthase|nr:6,7-dimethyl-8-ribityllumazine synthase [Dysgonamonadaceae bacterium]